MWESAIAGWPPRDGLDARFQDPRFALAFARLVTHYARHDAWIEDGSLLSHAGMLAGIPGVLVNGRLDVQSPLANAWELQRAWQGAELRVVETIGHDGAQVQITSELVHATDRFARR